MYSNFERLMKENGVTAYRVSKECGIAQSTLSDWKTGKGHPKADRLQKIADYFNVSIDYLLTGKDAKLRPLTVPIEIEKCLENEDMAKRLRDYADLLLKAKGK
jgi:transcriptional regulator with XRE-family HTH domain